MTACKKHSESPVKGYNQCAGCEIEALRAENSASLRVNQQLMETIDRQDCELEAARGLLDEVNTLDRSGETEPTKLVRRYNKLMRKVRAFLTATPAPEVLSALSAENQRIVPVEPPIATPHPLSGMAEQGERQEAQVMGRVHHNHDHEDPVRAVLNSIGRQLPDNAPLYADPQTSPDVRALVEAIAICEQEAAEWDSDAVVADKNYAAACAQRIHALAAHRQAQRK